VVVFGEFSRPSCALAMVNTIEAVNAEESAAFLEKVLNSYKILEAFKPSRLATRLTHKALAALARFMIVVAFAALIPWLAIGMRIERVNII
jgi:hypothetical protein